MLEFREQPAEISGVQTQFFGQIGGSRFFAVRDFVQHTDLGQGIRAAQHAVLEQADLLGVEAIEVPDFADSAGNEKRSCRHGRASHGR